jgi:hypothetical protein
MQNRRLGPLEPGGQEMVERALAGAARRLANRIGKVGASSVGVTGWPSKLCSEHINKGACPAQPFSPGRVNAA